MAGLGGSRTIEGAAAGGGVQVEARTSDMIVFDAPFVSDIVWLAKGASSCLLPLVMSNHVPKGDEAGEETVGTELGTLILAMVAITRRPCREEGADSESKRIGVLDLSNNLVGLSVFIVASDARGDGGRLGNEFCLDSSSLRLCKFDGPE